MSIKSIIGLLRDDFNLFENTYLRKYWFYHPTDMEFELDAINYILLQLSFNCISTTTFHVYVIGQLSVKGVFLSYSYSIKSSYSILYSPVLLPCLGFLGLAHCFQTLTLIRWGILRANLGVEVIRGNVRRRMQERHRNWNEWVISPKQKYKFFINQ